MVLFLLVLAMIAQILRVVVFGHQPAGDTVASALAVLIGDTVSSVTGYTGAGVQDTVSLDADPDSATVIYAFHFTPSAHSATPWPPSGQPTSPWTMRIWLMSEGWP